MTNKTSMKKFLKHFSLLVGIILLGFAPLFVVLISGLFAEANGCRLDESTIHECIVLGIDFGGLLYNMFVFGWFGLLTIPIGIIGGILFLLVTLIRSPR